MSCVGANVGSVDDCGVTLGAGLQAALHLTRVAERDVYSSSVQRLAVWIENVVSSKTVWREMKESAESLQRSALFLTRREYYT